MSVDLAQHEIFMLKFVLSGRVVKVVIKHYWPISDLLEEPNCTALQTDLV